MIKEADVNGDGEIEFDEFKDIMEKFFKQIKYIYITFTINKK